MVWRTHSEKAARGSGPGKGGEGVGGSTQGSGACEPRQGGKQPSEVQGGSSRWTYRRRGIRGEPSGSWESRARAMEPPGLACRESHVSRNPG